MYHYIFIVILAEINTYFFNISRKFFGFNMISSSKQHVFTVDCLHVTLPYLVYTIITIMINAAAATKANTIPTETPTAVPKVAKNS